MMVAAMCPACEQIDAVQSVSAAVSGGVSTGSAVGVGYVAGHLAPFGVATQSNTMLAQRLSPPAAPGTMSGLKLLGPVLLFVPVAAFIAGAISVHADNPGPMTDTLWGSSVITAMLLLLPAAIVGFAVVLPLWWLVNRRPAAKRVWRQRVNHLFSAYYCLRDDVIFDAGGAWARPEQYVANLFARR